MADFSQKELNPADINNGRRYIPGDGLTSEAVNLLVEAILYVQQHNLSLEDILNLLSSAEVIAVGDTTISRQSVSAPWLAANEVYVGENDDVVIDTNGVDTPHIKANTVEFGEDFKTTIDAGGTVHTPEVVVDTEIGVGDRAVVMNDAGISAPNIKTNTAEFGRNDKTTIDEYGTLTTPDINVRNEIWVGGNDEVLISATGINTPAVHTTAITSLDICVGENDETAITPNGIYLAEGASLHIGGEDALEGKLDKIPVSQASGTIVYIRDHLGSNSYRSLSANPAGGAIPIYNRSSTNQGVLKTATPEAGNDCANKDYVDDTQFWNSLEQQFTALDDEYYISLEANYQYQVSATMKIKYRRDGSPLMEYLNFNTGSLYVPSTDEVHEYGSIGSFIRLEAYTNEPTFEGMYLIIGEYYQDSVAEVIEGTDYYQTRIYIPEPAGYNVDIEEVQVITTWKKVY